MGQRGDREDSQHRHAGDKAGDHIEEEKLMNEPEAGSWKNQLFQKDKGDACRVRQEKVSLESNRLKAQPEQVEIGKMDDLAVNIVDQRPIDGARQEKTRDQEKVRHSEGLGESDNVVHPAGGPDHLAIIQRRMHHHHEDDADTLAVIDPINAVLGHFRSLKTSLSGELQDLCSLFRICRPELWQPLPPHAPKLPQSLPSLATGRGSLGTGPGASSMARTVVQRRTEILGL